MNVPKINGCCEMAPSIPFSEAKSGTTSNPYSISPHWIPYPEISPAYEELKEYVGFYPGPMDACYVDSEKVKPQAGSFYAGWITHDIVGPFKGDPGTWGW